MNFSNLKESFIKKINIKIEKIDEETKKKALSNIEDFSSLTEEEKEIVPNNIFKNILRKKIESK